MTYTMTIDGQCDFDVTPAMIVGSLGHETNWHSLEGCYDTPLKTNMDPENHWFVMVCQGKQSLRVPFSGSM